MLLLLPLALAAGTIQPASAPCEGFEIHNRTGCTAAGDYASRKEPSKEACCSACASQSKCQAWSFHAGAAECLLATNPKLATNPSTADTTCGCRRAGCLPAPPPPPGPCKSDLDCSLNGACLPSGACQCDLPWAGPVCGQLSYAVTPAQGKRLVDNASSPHNTWGAALVGPEPDGKYHALLSFWGCGPDKHACANTNHNYGTADSITGPYTWQPLQGVRGVLSGAISSALLVFTDPLTNRTVYSLWLAQGVHVADSLSGPFHGPIANFSCECN